MVQLILGGTRSGKSYYAEQLALNSGKKYGNYSPPP
ncbi:MAG: bifunctional adenosylcobinamide kinase/adenosylcobinamide-phosphate guanylyltransferase, partial [Methylococcales bacterium]|nr:bifunctional adenosylcobinamide kinase/adenosylcobinamide-phosphate guanylyltransferase [Methylococcales bacterium]